MIHALFPAVYAAVNVSDSQKGDNFRLMDRVLVLRLPPSVNIFGRRWAAAPEQWTGYRCLIFSFPLVSRLAQNAAFASLDS